MRSVAALYENLPFPKRDPADEATRLITPPHDLFARINHHCFEGSQSFEDNFNALVAGGGTGDSVIFLAHQLLERGSGRVTYLDISGKSMAVAQARAKARGLSNIDWIQGSILDLPNLDIGPFDYINCVGVIHHMDSPVAGLRALTSVLSENGAIGLMVYGKYGRQDIAAMRRAFSLLFDSVPTKDVAASALSVLKNVPPTNPYIRGRDRRYTLQELSRDLPNLADIFLNPIEYTFSAPELAEMVEDQCGLNIQAFTTYDGGQAVTRLQYNPAITINNIDLRKKISKYSNREQWEIAEILDGSIHLHCAYITKFKRFDALKNLDGVPYFPSSFERHYVKHLIDFGKINIRLSNYATFLLKINPITKHFLASVDDDKTINQIVSGMTILEKKSLEHDLSIISGLDWVLVRNQKVKPFTKLEAKFPDYAGDVMPYQMPVFVSSV